jgi:hypothetical protein
MQPDTQRNRVAPNQPVTQAPVQNNASVQQQQPTGQNTTQPVVRQPNVQQPVSQPANMPATNNSAQPNSTAASKDSGPMAVGSLLPFVTRQQAPVYPAAAKTMRTAGIVTVAVTSTNRAMSPRSTT